MSAIRSTLLLTLATSGQAGVLGRLAPGSVVPDVTLPALDDGRPVSLRALCRGKKTLLVNFASW